MRKLLVLILASLVLSTGLGVSHAPPAAASPATDEQDFLRLLNDARRANGRPALTINSALSGDARTWSAEMGRSAKLYHTPQTRMVAEVQRVVPNWRRIGENVGLGSTVASLHKAFWESTGHRANMLGDYTHVGIGVVHAGGRIWVTFRFVSGTPVVGTASATTTTGFPDVPDNAYYATAVKWLSKKGITTGVGTTGLYMPDQVVTRAQMAAFLHRLAGQPSASAPRFNDVPSTAYYAKAVTWMRARGITTGVGGTNSYRPNDPVTREQMAAFLHRFAGERVVSLRLPFYDVSGSFAKPAIAWLVKYGITTGTSPGYFSPRSAVTRAQMAAFIYRLATTPTAFDSDGAKIGV